MTALRLLAGPKAYQVLMEQGLKPACFSQILAASGGPKWLGIAGLDKYLFSQFFKDRQAPLYSLGASSGAWRLACLAQQNPLAAYLRLEEHYIGQVYESVPKPLEVSEQVKGVVQGILGQTGASDIVDNPVIRSHLVVCRARHINRVAGRAVLAAGLALTAGTNLLSRKTLGWHFERVLFSGQDPRSPFMILNDLPSQHAQLRIDNMHDVMLATGSIPMVLAPVRHIAGVQSGQYYDGGITDYHFDLPLHHAKGLTLYPHFFTHMSPGWFDKSLSWRRANKHYDNALVLAPSPEFVASLPYGKIPDRDDFKQLDTATRMKYWRTAVMMSERLADELDTLVSSGKFAEHLQRL